MFVYDLRISFRVFKSVQLNNCNCIVKISWRSFPLTMHILANFNRKTPFTSTLNEQQYSPFIHLPDTTDTTKSVLYSVTHSTGVDRRNDQTCHSLLI